MRLAPISWDRAFARDPVKNLITADAGVLKRKTKNEMHPEGIFSERFYGKMDMAGSAFSCSCGETVGRFMAGEKCPTCQTAVIESQAQVRRTAWVDLGGRFLHPLFYDMLARLGKARLRSVLRPDAEVDDDGNPLLSPEDAEHPWRGIGPAGMEQNYGAVLAWLAEEGGRKDPEKADKIVNFCLKHRKQAFFRMLPVMSPVLRPGMMVRDTFVSDEINAVYGLIIARANQLKAFSRAEAEKAAISLPVEWEIQEQLLELHAKNMDKLRSKGGYTRSALLSNRFNFTLRAVITPGPAELPVDGIIVPYLGMMELMKFHLINLLRRTRGLPYAEAEKAWRGGLARIDPWMLSLIWDLIRGTEGGIRVLFNRNPTINLGSIMQLRIVGVKEDYSDRTISINNLILKPLSGDYDGDTLNVFLLPDKKSSRAFASLEPQRLYISRKDGGFNTELAPDRDMILGLTRLVGG